MKKSTIGERIKLLRAEYRLSQADFAGAIGMSHIAIGNLERGIATNPQSETIDSIVNKFGTTVEWLVDGKGIMLPNGKADLNKVEVQASAIDPWKDALVSQLKEEATTWKEKYNDVWRTLSNIIERGNLGKLNALYFTGSNNRVVKGNRT